MTEPLAPRRSRRNAYKSLADLQRRAQAAIPADEAQAWGDAGLLDDADDDSFDEADLSDTGEDHVDSDFDDPEEAPPDHAAAALASEAAARADERRATKRKRSAYVDPARRRAPTKRVPAKRAPAVSAKSSPAAAAAATAAAAAAAAAATTTTTGPTPSAAPAAAAQQPLRARSSLRKSTKVASARAAELRRAETAAREARRAARAARDADRTPTRPPTQEELLAEAKDTEELNKESLQALLRVEEEKRRVAAPRPRALRHEEPVVSVRSRGGVSTVSVSEGVVVEDALFGAGATAAPDTRKGRAKATA